MEVLLLILSVFIISILLYINREHRKKHEDSLYLFSSSSSTGKKSISSIPPAPSSQETLINKNSEYFYRRNQDNTDGIAVTNWTKSQISKYLESDDGSSRISMDEATRIANLDPEEVVYLNDKQWFHPKACQAYPSKFSPGEELLVTIKGTWILKTPKYEDMASYDYKKVSKKDAFIFLESNGFEELAENLAPHNPSCEI